MRASELKIQKQIFMIVGKCAHVFCLLKLGEMRNVNIRLCKIVPTKHSSR